MSPDPEVRKLALDITLDAAEFAGEIGAHFIIWPGIEGYNYPFQTPYAESWEWLIDAMGQAAEVLAKHDRKLFLEHKNSEPAMKILMRNIGMTLHVVHTLRARGIDNVQVNMDWQHLIMNGEHLPEYAALLAAEGLLGHQHANSGWGTFDDDNMVGATAFMETDRARARAAPRELRGERRAPRLRPLPLHRGPGRGGQALGAAVAVHRLGRREDRRARAARGPEPQGRRQGLRAGVRGPRRMTRIVGLDVGTSSVKGLAVDESGAVLGVAERGYPLSTPRPGLERAGPRGLVARERRRARGARGRPRLGIGLSGQMHGLVALGADDTPAAPGDPLERRAHAGAVRARSSSASGASGCSS